VVYIGQSDPKYQVDFSTTMALFNSRLSVSANLSYQHGMTQTQGAADAGNTLLVNLPNAPYASLATQAAVMAAIGNHLGVNGNDRSSIGVMQTVNTLRFNSVSINYLLPARITTHLHVPTASLALQGSNIGLHSSYRGLDPNVNAISTSGGGDLVQDTGQLPQPRTWTLSIRLGN
jgi:hypothetical protein